MPLRDDLLNPIPGDNPSGANIRYAPVVEKIKEARREEDDAAQGDWKRERKIADYKLEVKLAGETLATKSKDLQLAAWLTEGLLGVEGFEGLHQGLELIRALIENFWLTIYPEIDEDGDLELRAAPVEWVGASKELSLLLKKTPITKGGYNIFRYQESRLVGHEDPSASQEQLDLRNARIAEGKITAEEFDKDYAATPTPLCESWRASLDACLETIEALQLLCEEKFGRQAPSFSPLQTAVQEVRHQIHMLLQKRLEDEGGGPEPGPVEEAAPASDGWGDAPAEATPRAPRKRGTVVGLDPEDLDDATARLTAVARFLRQQDPSSPGPYLLLRGYRWGELRGYGEWPDQTMLIPPDSEVRQAVKRLSLESNWSELLETAETAMAQPCGRAWMDLQRYVVRAAEESGYGAVAQAIRSELRALIQDLPGLPTWMLMDDTPTANPETQAWLREIAPPPAAAPDEPEPQHSVVSMMEDETRAPVMPEGEPAPPDTFELAMEAARQGRSSEAIHLLAEEIPRQRSGRARFQRKLQLAQICMMTGHEALAQPILEELTASIDAHNLEDWEASDVVAHPLVLLYRCLKQSEVDASVKSKLYARISRLDPVQAMECAR